MNEKKDNLDEIINLKMNEAGEAMRDYLSRCYFDSVTNMEIFGKPVYMKPLPWYRGLYWKIEDFRIWLSKRIYDWSSYEND